MKKFNKTLRLIGTILTVITSRFVLEVYTGTGGTNIELHTRTVQHAKI